ncbi:MAG: monovalent cation/H+ antiporter complex subunit F [Gemmatimonadota bacterium]
MIFSAASVAVLGTMFMAMTRALRGPTVFDRVLAVNMFGTKTVLLMCLVGFAVGRPEFMDVAIVYALMNFIGTLTILKYYEYGDLAATEPAEDRLEEVD